MQIKGTSFIKTSSLGEYEGYSDQRFDGAKRTSFYFEASDGVKIAVDYYLPTKDGKAAQEELPVVFHLTPYGRIASSAEVEKEFGIDDGMPHFDDWGIEGLLGLTRFGYVVAIADARGTGASFGVRVTTNSRREAEDGKEIIEWLAKAPFSNGNVGIAGYSYTGQTTLECVSTCPEGLKASFTCMTDFDKFDGWFRGGIPRRFMTQPDDFGDPDDEENVRRMVGELAAKTLPVDDDPDGVLLREACREHLRNGDQIGIMRDLVHRDSHLEADGEHWKVISMSTYKDAINASGVAIYSMGGIYDVFRRDTFVIYENVDLPKKLTLGPWYHMSQKFDPRWDVEMRRWFDRWLKGIDNGVDTENPVNYKLCSYNFERGQVAGADTGSYVSRKSWPYAEGSRMACFPAADGALALGGAPGPEGKLPYTDPYGCGTSAETPLTTNDQGTGVDQIGAVFTGAPLEADLDIVGHPMAHVEFSLDDSGWMEGDYDVDVFVSLSDYDPASGKAFLVTQGQLRASRRAEGECPYDFLELPWHPCREGEDEFLELGHRYGLDIDLLPTAYRIPRGHCLRMTLSNSYDRAYYHGCSEYAEDPSIAKPKVTFYLGGEGGTSLTLPNIYA